MKRANNTDVLNSPLSKELLNHDLNKQKLKFLRDNNLHKLNSTEMKNQKSHLRNLIGAQSAMG